jgi:hypothetical protein
MNHHLFVFAATELETAVATTATCDFVVRLLATITEDGAFIGGRGRFLSAPISGPGLFHFFQESQDNLGKVTLENLALNEE